MAYIRAEWTEAFWSQNEDLISLTEHKGSGKYAVRYKKTHRMNSAMQTVRYMSVQAVMHGSAAGFVGAQPRHLFIFAQKIKCELSSLSCNVSKKAL